MLNLNLPVPFLATFILMPHFTQTAVMMLHIKVVLVICLHVSTKHMFMWLHIHGSPSFLFVWLYICGICITLFWVAPHLWDLHHVCLCSSTSVESASLEFVWFHIMWDLHHVCLCGSTSVESASHVFVWLHIHGICITHVCVALDL